MADFFTTDKQRAKAAELRRLLIRLENGEGEDGTLGDAILNALAAPLTILDPTGCMDDVLHLADFIGQPRSDLLARATAMLRDKVRDGWKPAGVITQADVSRAMLTIMIRVQLATLERAPA